jgi:purine-nucleoside phosphorylase
MNYLDHIQASSNYIKSHYSGAPGIGVILGSGLNGFIDFMHVELEINYADIPHFPVSTVEGHSGKLIFGKLAGIDLVVMSGRFHYYEGYTPTEVVFPIRVLKNLGVNTLLISNAAGGVNPGFKVGDLMIIKDHISFAIVNPLLGKNHDELGPRFPDMSEPYSKELIKKGHEVASSLGIELKEGVYFGVTGPTFETRAEYKLIKILGADAVGMSTVQEVITAVHAGMTVFAMSVITDIGIREEENVITHADVLDAAKEAAPNLALVLKGMVGRI